MDPEVSVLLQCADWRGLVKSQVHVEISERFNRKTDPVLEQHIEEVWRERIIKEPWLFNGAKFRLHSFSLAPPPSVLPQAPPTAPQTLCRGRNGGAGGGDSPTLLKKVCLCDKNRWVPASSAFDSQLNSSCGRVKDHVDQSGHTDRDLSCGVNDIEAQTSTQTTDFHAGDPGECKIWGTKFKSQLQPYPERDTCGGHKAVLTLRLGLTCYKDFLGTNWSQEAGELRLRGETEFGDPLSLLAQPLGVGGVLCTCDGQVVLIRRSQRVAEAGGLLDIPGGHPEPKAVCEGVCVGEDQLSVELLQKSEEAVITELFSSVCTEIRDEVNVPMGSLGEPVLMGVALNHTSSGRPSAEFYIRCSLSSAEVRELYWQGGAEAHESTDIVFLSQTELLQLDKSSPLWSELCPSAKGAVVLYQLVLPDHQADSTKPTQSLSIPTS